MLSSSCTDDLWPFAAGAGGGGGNPTPGPEQQALGGPGAAKSNFPNVQRHLLDSASAIGVTAAAAADCNRRRYQHQQQHHRRQHPTHSAAKASRTQVCDCESRRQVMDNPALMAVILGVHRTPDRWSRPLWRLGAVCKTWHTATLQFPRLLVFRSPVDARQVQWAKGRLQDGWDIYCDGDTGVDAVSQVLRSKCQFTTLSLANCGCADLGAKAVADMLQVPPVPPPLCVVPRRPLVIASGFVTRRSTRR